MKLIGDDPVTSATSPETYKGLNFILICVVDVSISISNKFKHILLYKAKNLDHKFQNLILVPYECTLITTMTIVSVYFINIAIYTVYLSYGYNLK